MSINAHKLSNSSFLFPEIYISDEKNLFCVSYFESNPSKMDIRDPEEKLKDLQERLNTKNLSPQDKFTILSQINSLMSMLYGEFSIQVLRSEAELGFLYDENLYPLSALRHLEKAHSLEKRFKIGVEESINIAAEIALAHLYLRKKRKIHIMKAKESIEPYYNSKITNSIIRFKRDLSRSRILAIQKKYNESFQSYQEALDSLQESNSNQISENEGNLCLEIAKIIEQGSKSIQNYKEKASEYYMRAHKIFLQIGDKESANNIDLNKLKSKNSNEDKDSIDEDDHLLSIPLNPEKN